MLVVPTLVSVLVALSSAITIMVVVFGQRAARPWVMPEGLTADQQRWVIYHLQLAGIEYVSPTIARLERAQVITSSDIANMDLATYSAHRDDILKQLNEQAYNQRLKHQDRCEWCDEALLHSNHELFG